MTGVAGCGDIQKVRYSCFYSLPESGWNPEMSLEYTPWPTDSILNEGDRFDVVVCVRYSRDARPQGLDMTLSSFTLADEKPDTVPLSFTLFSPAGKPLGKGGYGVYEVTDTVARGIALSEGYNITLLSRADAASTAGVSDIGVILLNSQPEEPHYKP